MRKSSKLSFARWLCKVRYCLRYINAITKKTKLDAKSWQVLYDENLTPTQAINENLEIKYNWPYSI